MPELIEVEATRELVDSHCCGAILSSITSHEAGGGPREGEFDDIIICEGMTPTSLEQQLSGRSLASTSRVGKQMWLTFTAAGDKKRKRGKEESPESVSLLLHLGMTGSVAVKSVKSFSYVQRTVDACGEWPPKFTKLQLGFSNGKKVAFVDPRRLGRIRLRPGDPMASPPLSKLAPDAYHSLIHVDSMIEALGKISAPLKAVLLNQERILSGVGNWIADEVCYQSGIHPESVCRTLGDDQVKSLHKAIELVMSAGVGCKADYKQFPSDWLFHYRWGKGKNNSSKDAHGNPIEFVSVGGRTTAVVAKVQRKGNNAPAKAKTETKRKTPAKAKGKGRAAKEKQEEKVDGEMKKGKAKKAKVEAEEKKEEKVDGEMKKGRPKKVKVEAKEKQEEKVEEETKEGRAKKVKVEAKAGAARSRRAK